MILFIKFVYYSYKLFNMVTKSKFYSGSISSCIFLEKISWYIWRVLHLWAILCQRGTKFSILSSIVSDLIKFCSNVPANKKQKWAKFLHLTLNCSWDIGFWNVGNFTAFFSDIYHFEFSISNEIVITWVL